MDTKEMRRVLQNLDRRLTKYQRFKMRKEKSEQPWLLEMQVKKRWITVYRFDDEATATDQLLLRRKLLRSVEWRVIHRNDKQEDTKWTQS